MLNIIFEIAFVIMYSATIASGFIARKYNKFIPVIFIAVACAVLSVISWVLDSPVEKEAVYSISIALLLISSIAMVVVSFVVAKRK